MAKKHSHKKISQKQNVKQTVIIKLDREGKRIKVKRRRIKKYQEQPEMQFKQFPPPVVYQSSYQVPVPVFQQPEKPKTIGEEPKPTPFLEDLGLVGTEGAVEILPVPTKKEALSELMTPVPLPSESMILEPIKKPRRTKKEMQEARQMEREDIASYNLGLSQFNPLFTRQDIQENLPKQYESQPIREEKNIPESFNPQFQEQSILERKPLLTSAQKEELIQQIKAQKPIQERKTPKANWADLTAIYNMKTGENISRQKAKSIYKTIDNFVSVVKDLVKKKEI